MASIETRKTKGKLTRYRVKWRTGGRRDGATFDAIVLAVKEPQVVVTFEVYALQYLGRLVKPNPETRRKYSERLRVHVFPVIGERPVAEITRREMRESQEGLLAKRLSPETIQNIRGETVSPIFEAACLPGEDDEPPLRTLNPLKGLQVPERVRSEREIVEDQREARPVIEAAYEVDPNAADLMLMLLATGMRSGSWTIILLKITRWHHRGLSRSYGLRPAATGRPGWDRTPRSTPLSRVRAQGS